MRQPTILLLASLLLLSYPATSRETLNAHQMISYSVGSTKYGPFTGKFNSFAVNASARSSNVKAVVFQPEEFRKERLRKAIETKATGLVVLIDSANFEPSAPWMEAYEYLQKKATHVGVYFVENTQQAQQVLAGIGNKKGHKKLIAEYNVQKHLSKIKYTDIVGEIQVKGRQAGQSTMLVSGIDSTFLSADGVYDFAASGAGLLAHVAIHRSLYHLTAQYPDEFNHNLMSYFTSTKYKNFKGVDLFMKKNDHSHFTTGIDSIFVLKRLSGSKKLRCVVYNVDEANSMDFTALDSLKEALAEDFIEVEVQFNPESYFEQFAGVTIVIDDAFENRPSGDKTSLAAKVKGLTSFFIRKVYGVSSDKFNLMAAEKSDSAKFLEEYRSYLEKSPRDPTQVANEGRFSLDFQSMIKKYMRKHTSFTYAFKDHAFAPATQATLKVVTAKHALFDLFMFFGIMVYLLVLTYVCGYVGYPASPAKQE